VNQPDLIPPDPTTSTLTVSGSDLARTEQRLRDLGAVVLGFSVKGSTYTTSTSTSTSGGPAMNGCAIRQAKRRDGHRGMGVGSLLGAGPARKAGTSRSVSVRTPLQLFDMTHETENKESNHRKQAR
jgi:hypothetical protein